LVEVIMTGAWPGHPRLGGAKDVDARDKPGHDGDYGDSTQPNCCGAKLRLYLKEAQIGVAMTSKYTRSRGERGA
jgi:hypothetical protein